MRSDGTFDAPRAQGRPDQAPNTRLAVVRKKQSITKTAPAKRAMLRWESRSGLSCDRTRRLLPHRRRRRIL